MNKLIRTRILSLLAAGMVAVGTLSSPVLATTVQPQGQSTAAATPAPTPAYADPSVVTTNGLQGWPKAQDISSETGCVLDADTGAIIYNKKMDQKMFPASTTKIMTALIALEKGNMGDTVTLDQQSVKYATSGSSNLDTKVGEQFKLGDMMYGMMLKSANDIATGIAVHIGNGSVANFVKMMNDKAAELGCTNTHFNNACGMPDDAHWTTAHDMARIARACFNNKNFMKIVGTVTYTIPATNMTAARTVQNHVGLYVNPQFKYPGVVGGKTGTTDAAGSCLVSFYQNNGRRLVTVSMKASDGGQASISHRTMLDYATKNTKAVSTGIDAKYVVSGSNKVTLPNDAELKDCKVEEKDGPASNGQETRVRTYTYNGYTVGTMTVYKAAVTSDAAQTDSVQEASSTESGASAAETTGERVSGVKNSLSGVIQSVRSGKLSQIPRDVVVIGVLGILVIIGVILIIVSSVKRKHRKHKRK